MVEDPGHFLSCPLLRPLARVRHDRLVRLLATLIQRWRAAYVEPRYLEDKRPDIHAFFLMPVSCWMSVWFTLLLLLVLVSLLALRLSIARRVRLLLMSR